jgi:hypothetical protein
MEQMRKSWSSSIPQKPERAAIASKDDGQNKAVSPTQTEEQIIAN